MPAQIEQIRNRSMSAQEPLSLPDRFKLSHTSLSHPRSLMRLLRSIILVLFSDMDHFRHQLTMSNTIASQFICHDLPGLTTVIT